MGFRPYLELKFITKIRGQEGISTIRVFKDATFINSNLILKSNCNTNRNTKIDGNKSKAHVDVSRVSTNKRVNEYITNKLVE